MKSQLPLSIGVSFPSVELGAAPPELIRDFAVGVQIVGYQHVLVLDHVVGADPTARRGWRSLANPFDALTLLAFLAGLADLELCISVRVLPQRPTAIVAKQAAEVDLLSGGRLRLAVGVGWNELEYRALGQSFHARCARLEAQIALLRDLWTRSSDAKAHIDAEDFDGVGISPLPVQRRIPIWLGCGTSPKVLRRIGRFADGWIPMVTPGPTLAAAWDLVGDAAQRAGRQRSQLGLQGTVFTRNGMSRMIDHLRKWVDAGATHVAISTAGAGLSPAEHVTVLVDAHSHVLDAL